MKHVTETKQTSDQTYKRGNGVLLVLTYYPPLKNVSNTIKKHLVFLNAKEQVDNMFTPPSFVSFRIGFSLRKHLVRAKVYPLYVNVDHLVVTKVDVRLDLMLTTQRFFRVLLQRSVTK